MVSESAPDAQSIYPHSGQPRRLPSRLHRRHHFLQRRRRLHLPAPRHARSQASRARGLGRDRQPEIPQTHKARLLRRRPQGRRRLEAEPGRLRPPRRLCLPAPKHQGGCVCSQRGFQGRRQGSQGGAGHSGHRGDVWDVLRRQPHRPFCHRKRVFEHGPALVCRQLRPKRRQHRQREPLRPQHGLRPADQPAADQGHQRRPGQPPPALGRKARAR
mmetsp:Transcript_14188/g.47368  ORF Transcript_14188/g.47368 Transcript_14188/m.47368 type:complete len:215 (+) Transcript_14188:2945-3589(+)